jgi:chromosome segregation ATPase
MSNTLPSPKLSASIENLGRPPVGPSGPVDQSIDITNSANFSNLNATATLQNLQSLNQASLSMSGAGPNALPKTANFLNQLEGMMAAVKKEASALESMKIKLKEMEEVKTRYSEVKRKLQDSEQEIYDYKKKISDYEHNLQEMRKDMQKLNDLFNSNSLKLMETQTQLQKTDSEIASLKLEKDYLFKENEKHLEYKKINKNMKIQFNSLKQTLEDEKTSAQQQITDWQNKFTKVEKSKSEISNHVYELTEQLEKLKGIIQEKNVELQGNAEVVNVEKDKFSVYKERSLMIIEDLKARYELKLLKIKKIIPENSSLTIEIVKLQQIVNNKNEENHDLTNKLSLLEEKYLNLKMSQDKLIQGMGENQKEMSSKNSHLLQENNSLKSKFIIKQNENETLQNELLNLKNHLTNQETTFGIKEMELSNSLKSVQQQKEEFSYKLTQLTGQYETLNNSYKTETSKYWDELHKLKSTENALMEENERLSTEVQQVNMKLHYLENEHQMSQKQLENKSFDNNQIVTTLKEELEKRVNELISIRQEKETLAEKEKEMSSQLTEFKLEYSKLDTLMKKTLESEKTKYSKELVLKNNRIKNLETEKGELLSETHELMNQLNEKQKEITIIKSLSDEKISSVNKLSDSVDLMKLELQEKNKEINSLHKQEKEMEGKLIDAQNHFSHEVNKYETLLKETKKSFSQQVLELNQSIQVVMKENDSYKSQLHNKEDLIGGLEREKEKIVHENQKLLSKNNEINEQFNNEITNLRKEILDLRNKYKIVLENKNLLEKEILNLQRNLNNQDQEKSKILENNKNYESQLSLLSEKITYLQQTNDHLTTTNTQLACKNSELENVMNHRNLLIDNLQNNITNLEKDSILEIKRLKLIIGSLENENSEVKTMSSSYLKEINEYKNNLNKISNNNQSTINNIMEDMKKTEENLMKEKRLRAKEQDEYFQKSKEYEMNLELLQKSCHDITNNFKNDSSKLEMKITLIEQENERLKSQLKEKDLRNEEIENNSFSYRKKILENKEKMELLEQDLQEYKNKYDNEMNQRKRLETRVKQLSEQQSDRLLNSINAEDVNTLIPPRSRGGNYLSDGGFGGRDGRDGSSNNGMNMDPYDFSSLSARGSNPMKNGGGIMNPPHGRSFYNDFATTSTTNANNNYSDYNDHNQMIASSSMKNLSSGSGDDYTTDLKTVHSVPTLPLQYQNSNNNNNYNNNGSNLTVASDFSSSQVSRQTHLQSFQSPSRNSNANNQNNNFGPPSPAVDRVSAALALKLAQQQRSTFPVSNPNPNPSDNRSVSSNITNNTANNMSNNNNRGYTRPPSAGMSSYAKLSRENNYSSNINPSSSFSRPAPIPMPSSYKDDDILAADYNNTSDNQSANSENYQFGGMVYPGGSQISANTSHNDYMNELTNLNNNNTSSNNMGSGSGNSSNNAIEESIRRAQDKINRKLGRGDSFTHQPNNPNQQSNIHSTPSGAGIPADKTPTSARSASKLHETIQHAHSLYPASPSASFEKQQQFGLDSEQQQQPDNFLSVPSMKPLSPPSLDNPMEFASAFSTQGGGEPKATKKKKGTSKKKSTSSSAANLDPNSVLLPKIPK